MHSVFAKAGAALLLYAAVEACLWAVMPHDNPGARLWSISGAMAIATVYALAVAPRPPIKMPPMLPLMGLTACMVAAMGLYGAVMVHYGIETAPESLLELLPSTTTGLIVFIVTTSILAPLFEELVFRGMVQPGLMSLGLGALTSVMATSTLWAALHLDYPLALKGYVFVLGLVLGGARQGKSGLWGSVILHAINNSLATIWFMGR